MGKGYFIIISFVLITRVLHAQENHFSQFYNSPQYLNPAFAGDAAYMRIGGSSRLMKPAAGFNIINSLIQFDIKPINYNSGFGVLIYDHTEYLSHSKIQFNYSYTIKMSKSGWAKGGIGISANQRRSNANALKYPDQFSDLGYTGSATMEPSLSDKSYFPALTARIILYNKFVWFSLSGDYLNQPMEDFAGEKNVYPAKICASTGFLFPLDKDKTAKRRFSKFGGLKPFSSIGPVVNFIKQEKYTEFSGGCSFNLQPIYGGVHLRYQHDFSLESTKYAYKALVILAGYRQEEFTIAYSYDFSFSSYSINQNGAHEISLVFYFSHFKEDYKRHDLVPIVSQMLY
jgi:type IX secretion system PorP/SprF family membrane protein